MIEHMQQIYIRFLHVFSFSVLIILKWETLGLFYIFWGENNCKSAYREKQF